jgi:integrase
MASTSRDKNGNTTIQFVGNDGKRRSIRMGKMTQHAADTFKGRVEVLVAAKAANLAIDIDTAKWLAGLGDELHGRLTAVGLVGPRATGSAVALSAFADEYIAGRTDAKPSTISNLKMFRDRLVAFFGDEQPLASIKRSDADAWVLHLKREYAAGTTGRTIKGARQLFKAAVRAEVVTKNPFDDIKAGSHTDKDRQFFVTLQEAEKVIQACPDQQWRLVVALSRFGGLRTPSEHLALTWSDVDWERARVRIDSPKTGERWIPLFAELKPYLEEAFDAAEDGGDKHVVTSWRDSTKNLRTRFAKIIRRAGLTPWPKLFQNLRASRETELAAIYPLHVVCAWIGNSPAVAQKHYLQTIDADFERAAKSGASALQKAVQHTPAQRAPVRTDSHDAIEVSEHASEVLADSGVEKTHPVRPEGFEPPTYGSVGHCSIQLS